MGDIFLYQANFTTLQSFLLTYTVLTGTTKPFSNLCFLNYLICPYSFSEEILTVVLSDRSSPGAATLSKYSKIILSFMEEFSISDPWHFLNPSGSAYSSFSNVHRTFTCIDYFLIDNHLLPAIQSFL